MKQATCIALLLGFSVPAYAHPSVERGIAHYEAAEFDEALEAFAAAERADDLTRDELETLYLTRALVHSATGNRNAMRNDLQRLAALDPDRELGRSVNPRVRRAFRHAAADVSQPLAIEVDIGPANGELRIQAQVSGDIANLVRDVRVYAELGGRWQSRSDELLVPAHRSFRYYVEAEGAGGVVLVHQGDRRSPRSYGDVGEFLGDAGLGLAEPGTEENSGSHLGWWIAGGTIAVAAATAGIILAVIFSGGSDDTVVGAPSADFP
ncbi:MAG: hypothetical protein AAGF12_22975 [Myxococcota bacterium]